MKTVGIWLEPLDVLFFRDGRPFAAASRAETGLPTPQVLAGALRTALLQKYGCDFGTRRRDPAELFAGREWIEKARLRGPWLARGGPSSPEPMVPVPPVLHTPKVPDGRLVRLVPLCDGVLPGWDRESRRGLRPLWLPGGEQTEPAAGYLGLDGLREFLAGGVPAAGSVVKASELFDRDHRTGIAVDPDRLTAADEQIYAVSLLALKRGVGFYAEAEFPADAPGGPFDGINTVAFGGEGRRAALSEAKPFAWPSAEPKAGQKPLILLTTPCPNRDTASAWRPAALAKLAAAAVASPLAVSGWDMARNGPRPVRFAAPAGAVYFLDELSAGLPAALADDPAEAALGWGCYLKGVWDNA